MTRDRAAASNPEGLRQQLANWLRLIELSGTKEIILSPGSAREVDVGLEAGARARAVAEPEAFTQPRPERHPMTLSSLRERIASCRRCVLHKTRTNVVFGEGNPSSELMFIGEGPGRDEDLTGRPFVGRAGDLLTRIIQAMGLEREKVYIANVVKCRPPGNRNPEPDEISECLPYLERQVELIKPKVICTLGNVATRTLTAERRGISSMRGTFYDYKGVRLMPTFHPAACLRNPSNKKNVWEDIKKVMKELGLPIGE